MSEWEAQDFVRRFFCQPPCRSSGKCPNENMWENTRRYSAALMMFLTCDVQKWKKKKHKENTNIFWWKSSAVHIEDTDGGVHRAQWPAPVSMCGEQKHVCDLLRRIKASEPETSWLCLLHQPPFERYGDFCVVVKVSQWRISSCIIHGWKANSHKKNLQIQMCGHFPEFMSEMGWTGNNGNEHIQRTYFLFNRWLIWWPWGNKQIGLKVTNKKKDIKGITLIW